MAFVPGLLAIVLLGVGSNGDVALDKLLKPYWLFEGQEIRFACIAKNIDNQYAIKWFWRNGPEITTSSGSGVNVTNFRNGSTLTSAAILKYLTRYGDKKHYILCNLVKNATVSQEAFIFRSYRNKNRPNVTVSVDRTTLEYGDNITLRCNARGNIFITNLDITWNRNGSVVKQKRQSAAGEVVDLHYTINKTDGSSGGDYVCRAYVLSRGVVFQDNDTVSLSVLPKLIGTKNRTMYCNVGESVSVPCDIDGYPLSISWQKKSGGTFQKISGRGRFIIGPGGRNLEIRRFESTDATVYVCKNMGIVQTTTLIKRVTPRFTSGSPRINVTFIPGRSLTLTCKIYAVPSCISWNMYHPGNSMKHNVTGIPGVYPPTPCNKTLWFTNVSEIANGQVFSCAVGSLTQNFTVVKMTVPRLTGPKTKEVSVEDGEDVSLECEIDVNPLIIKWEVDDRVINASTDTKYKISENRPLILRIDDVDYDDRRSFYCSAENVLSDKVQQEIILRVKDPNRVLWPIIGIIIAAVLVGLFIGIGVCYKKKCKAQEQTDAHVLTEIGGRNTQQDGKSGPDEPLITKG